MKKFRITERPSLTLTAVQPEPQEMSKGMLYVIGINPGKFGDQDVEEVVLALGEAHALAIAKTLEAAGLNVSEEIQHCWVSFI
jgi:hypothetical protein